MHPRYDIDHWVRVFPLEEVRKESDALRSIKHPEGVTPPPPWWDAWPVFSPNGIALNEQIRRAIWPDLVASSGVPCDLFTWAWGEPDDPACTKIGGLPFMSRSESWPLDPEGKPMGFVAQINFEDSMDLVGDLPGKLLLFFSQLLEYKGEAHVGFSEDPGSYCLRWVDPASVTDPIGSDTRNPLPLWPLHGHIYRSFDVPSRDYWFLLPDSGWTVDDPLYKGAFPPAIWWGTKIGGVPHWEQGLDLGITPPGARFLCQIISDRSSPRHYPYIRKPAFSAPDLDDWWWLHQNHRLVLGDVGSVYVFLRDGELEFRSQS